MASHQPIQCYNAHKCSEQDAKLQPDPKKCCLFCGKGAKKGGTRPVANPDSYAPLEPRCKGSTKAHAHCYDQARAALHELMEAKAAELHAAHGGRASRSLARQLEEVQVKTLGPRESQLSLLVAEGYQFICGLAEAVSSRLHPRPLSEGEQFKFKFLIRSPWIAINAISHIIFLLF